MSIETVNEFLVKVNEDLNLQEELAKAIEAKNAPKAVTKLAAKYGFIFTEEELISQTEQFMASQENELNEADLEAIAGGFVTVMTANSMFRLLGRFSGMLRKF